MYSYTCVQTFAVLYNTFEISDTIGKKQEKFPLPINCDCNPVQYVIGTTESIYDHLQLTSDSMMRKLLIEISFHFIQFCVNQQKHINKFRF